MKTTTASRILVSLALLCALPPTAALAQADAAAQQAARPCPESRPCLPGEAEGADDPAAAYWLGHPASLSPLADASDADAEHSWMTIALPAGLAGLALIVGFLRNRKRPAHTSAAVRC